MSNKPFDPAAQQAEFETRVRARERNFRQNGITSPTELVTPEMRERMNNLRAWINAEKAKLG
ncbi:MAG: hypothetical protein VX730_03975 [Pseudomonadota bacterium]|nr:hypothetical protein [Pseudomonadota bacterium]